MPLKKETKPKAVNPSTCTEREIHIITKASPIEALTTLEEPENIETWIFTHVKKKKKIKRRKSFAQSAGAVEYTDCTSAEG